MGQRKKDSHRICMNIEKSVFTRLENYSKLKSQTITAAVESIISEYFDSVGIPKEFPDSKER